MSWVLLQSESPWQRNDAITFFIYLCVSLYQEFFEETKTTQPRPQVFSVNGALTWKNAAFLTSFPR